MDGCVVDSQRGFASDLRCMMLRLAGMIKQTIEGLLAEGWWFWILDCRTLPAMEGRELLCVFSLRLSSASRTVEIYLNRWICLRKQFRRGLG